MWILSILAELGTYIGIVLDRVVFTIMLTLQITYGLYM